MCDIERKTNRPKYRSELIEFLIGVEKSHSIKPSTLLPTYSRYGIVELLFVHDQNFPKQSTTTIETNRQFTESKLIFGQSTESKRFHGGPFAFSLVLSVWVKFDVVRGWKWLNNMLPWYQASVWDTPKWNESIQMRKIRHEYGQKNFRTNENTLTWNLAK